MFFFTTRYKEKLEVENENQTRLFAMSMEW